jgi:hypothetical protein
LGTSAPHNLQPLCHDAELWRNGGRERKVSSLNVAIVSAEGGCRRCSFPGLLLQSDTWSTRTRPYFDIICSHSSLLCCMFFCTRNQVTVEEAYVAGQKVMGRANRRKLLSSSPEDLRFRAFFGVSAQVAVTAWSMMEVHVFSPSIPSSSIFCGHLHLCEHIPQTTPLSHVCWGGVTPRR